jgi:ribosomal-protein-alanine N-acetyltransferase
LVKETQLIYDVRPMQIEDIPQVTEIDHEAFPTFWPPIPFKQELNNKFAHYLVAWEKPLEAVQPPQIELESKNPQSGSGRLAWWKLKHLVSKERFFGDYLVGYAASRQTLDEAHLTSIAVRETYRRKGIGELLLISVINLAIQLGAEIITLEVRASNLPAQALYQKYGFAGVGLRHKYYSDNGEDALIMSTKRITTTLYQGHFQQLKQDYAQKWGTSHHPLS